MTAPRGRDAVLSFAPNGLQEFRAAIEKAISGARRYIYLEDQAFWSREIMKFIHDALQNQPDLRVILLTGGADPNDVTQPGGYLANAMNIGLLKGDNEAAGAPELPDAAKDRVRIYRRLTEINLGTGVIQDVDDLGGGIFRLTIDAGAVPPNLDRTNITQDKLAFEFNAQVRQGGETFPVVANPPIFDPTGVVVVDVKPGAFDIFTTATPTTGTFELFRMVGILIHAKTLLVDDSCAIIGSANAMRRSLYTDMEHSIVFIDAATSTAITKYRCDLWADHFRHGTATDFTEINGGLHAWNRRWFTAGVAPARPNHIIQMDLPIVAPALTQNEKDAYDIVQDVDSRQPLNGFQLLRMARQAGITP